MHRWTVKNLLHFGSHKSLGPDVRIFLAEILQHCELSIFRNFAHISEKSYRIFMKLSSQINLWTRKFQLTMCHDMTPKEYRFYSAFLETY